VARRLIPLLCAAVLVGCPDRTAQPSPDGGAVSAGQRGLRVDLPEGWTARVDSDGSLLLGPAGRPVLRVTRRAEPKEPPSAESLSKLFRSEMRGARVRTLERREVEGGSLWLGEVTPPNQRESWQVMLGARRLDDETLLCATLPDARPNEVQQAAELCTHLGAPVP